VSGPVVEGVPFEGLAPGAVLGILGGGQLARMIALAAADLGVASHIFAPEPENPAFDVAAAKTVAPYEDEAALARFADAVDVVTYEFENVPAATAAFLAARKPLHPGAHALAVTQDRLSEKRFVSEQGLTVAPFRAVDSLADLEDAVAALGRPCVLKTRRFGYDGKGQVKILPGTDLAEAYEAIGRQPAVLEGFVSFAREVSVVAARGTDGSFAAFDLCENEHRDHILAFTRIPAQVSAATEAAAAMSASSRSRCSSSARGQARASSSTRSRRGCTTPGTGPARAPRPRSSTSMSAPSAASRSARPPVAAVSRWRT